MRKLCLPATCFFLFTSFATQLHQKEDVCFYRPDIGMYFHYTNIGKEEKIQYMQHWDFYFSLKNDSVAIIREIRNKVVQEPKEYKVSPVTDSTYVKRKLGGSNTYKTERMYFRKILM